MLDKIKSAQFQTEWLRNLLPEWKFVRMWKSHTKQRQPQLVQMQDIWTL